MQRPPEKVNESVDMQGLGIIFFFLFTSFDSVSVLNLYLPVKLFSFMLEIDILKDNTMFSYVKNIRCSRASLAFKFISQPLPSPQKKTKNMREHILLSKERETPGCEPEMKKTQCIMLNVV